jgi:membrane protease YdiL (CAAX protease family)
MVYVRPDRLRSGWRIALFLLAGFAASNVAVPLIGMAVPTDTLPWLRPSLECLAVLFGTRYACVTIDKRGWAAVALGSNAWRPSLLGVGALTGALAIAVPTGVLIAIGDLTFVAAPSADAGRTLLLSVAVLAPAALTEELLMRGYPFAVLSETWGWPAAIAITSVIFGVLHLGNPGVTPIAIANVMAAGVFLAGVRIVTGSLAAAWAAHFAWNWTMSAGFHTAVSGLPFGTPGYRLVDSGPDWLSGGAWGPEGGVVAAGGMIGAFTGLAWVMGRTRRADTPSDASALSSMHVGGPVGHQEHEA